MVGIEDIKVYIFIYEQMLPYKFTLKEKKNLFRQSFSIIL